MEIFFERKENQQARSFGLPAGVKPCDDGGYSYVFKQPENEDEEKQCKEAMEGCPVEAIGNNGP